MCEPTTMLFAATAVSGGVGAYQSYEAGSAQSDAQKFNSGEMQKQIEQVKLQATAEELERRSQNEYLVSSNRAAAAASGVMMDSESFGAISDENRELLTRDIELIRTNASVARGQMAGQQYQYDEAARYAKFSGKVGAAGTLLQTGAAIAGGMPASPASSGAVQISGPAVSSRRPTPRPRIGVIGG